MFLDSELAPMVSVLPCASCVTTPLATVATVAPMLAARTRNSMRACRPSWTTVMVVVPVTLAVIRPSAEISAMRGSLTKYCVPFGAPPMSAPR